MLITCFILAALSRIFLKFGCILALLLALPLSGQVRGAFAYLTPLTGITAEATDQDGNLYATGAGAVQATPGAFQSHPQSCGHAGCAPVYVAKLDPAGRIVYIALIGGSDVQYALAIAVDPAGEAIVTGSTYSPDFPVTAGAVQHQFAGPPDSLPGGLGGGPPGPGGDAFIAKLNAAGSALVFSTFLGGSSAEIPHSIAVDVSGCIYVGGETASVDFPMTAGTYGGPPQRTCPVVGFVTKLNADGSGFLFSAFFNAEVGALTLDAAGAIYLGGVARRACPLPTTPGAFQTDLHGTQSAYAAKLSPDAARLEFGTLLGGSGFDGAGSIAVSPAGVVILGGTSGSNDFPALGAGPISIGQAFVAGISPDGGSLLWSYTPGGGSILKIVIASDGSMWIFGSALPANPAPPTPDAFETGTSGTFAEDRDIDTGSLIYSTTIREGPALALDSRGNVYIGGGVAQAAGKIDFSLAAANPVIGNVMNAGTYDSYAITPGEVVAIFGDRIGPAAGVIYNLDAQSRAPRSLGGVAVLFNGIQAPLLYAQGSQVNAIVPWEVSGSTVQVVVQYNGQVSQPFAATVKDSVPGPFLLGGVAGAPKQTAAINQDGTINSPANPAPLGSIVSIYATGLGRETTIPVDGSVTPDASYVAVNPVTVGFFGGVAGRVLYAGGAPRLLAGVWQINVQLPESIPNAPNLSAVPVLIKSGNGFLSAVGPSVAVK
jgi:uncharacterized protein (TIGR03437 family)